MILASATARFNANTRIRTRATSAYRLVAGCWLLVAACSETGVGALVSGGSGVGAGRSTVGASRVFMPSGYPNSVRCPQPPATSPQQPALEHSRARHGPPAQLHLPDDVLFRHHAPVTAVR